MSEYAHLKKVCQDNGQAITMSFKPGGDVLIYVNPDCTEKEMMSALILASTRIAQERVK